jgi:predicted DNA-binding transcriptional regulator YafY
MRTSSVRNFLYPVRVLDTSTRLLRLLAVLQSRRFWTGTALAERLGITSRTLRRDIDRLRSLGYTVSAAAGPGGGYQLGQGTALPPLLLDDDEAVAIVVSLRSAVDAFAGVSQTVVGALVKLNQLLPTRLRKRVSALQAVTVSVAGTTAVVNPMTLTTLATACRDHRQITLRYRDRVGRISTRTVEPLRLAHTGSRRWYLVAWDLSREAWRTLRVDRIDEKPSLGAPFVPRPPPPDVERYVLEAISYAPYRHRARFVLAASAAEVAERIPPWIGVIEPVDGRRCVLSTGAETPEALVFQVMLCGVDFELTEPESLRPHLREIAARLQRAAREESLE